MPSTATTIGKVSLIMAGGMRQALLALPLVVASSLGRIDGASQGPTNVLVVRDRTEPIAAVDPRAPSTIIVGTNTDYHLRVKGTYPVGFFTSRDGGRSFNAGSAPVVDRWTTEADPSLVIANTGTAFLTYLAESRSYCTLGGSAVILSRSYDHGRSFGYFTVVAQALADDKPFSAVEDITRHRVHIFVTWTRKTGSTLGIWFARSVDGGDSFSHAAELYNSTENNFGAIPVVGPRGHVYVVWSTYPGRSTTQPGTASLLLRASSDDGRHFGPPRVVVSTYPTLARMALPGQLRNQPLPSMVAAADGSLFLAWAQRSRVLSNGAAEADILVSRSSDDGLSWSRPGRVNDVRVSDRFMPALALLSDGSLGVVFYDRRVNL